MSDHAHHVGNALVEVRRRIRDAERRFEREPDSVALLAVSKKKPVAMLRAAIEAGQHAFGENYPDEGIEKIEALANESLEWHFVGSIQSRQTAGLAEHFDWVHGVDREKVARRLSEQRPEGRVPLNVCLQVNIDDEDSKSGVAPGELAALADYCASLPGIALRGLMCIPAPRDDHVAQRQICREIAALYRELRERHPTMDTLSMGMTDDLEAAVAEGSTLVRVGTAIFGARD